MNCMKKGYDAFLISGQSCTLDLMPNIKFGSLVDSNNSPTCHIVCGVHNEAESFMKSHLNI